MDTFPNLQFLIFQDHEPALEHKSSVHYLSLPEVLEFHIYLVTSYYNTLTNSLEIRKFRNSDFFASKLWNSQYLVQKLTSLENSDRD